MKKEKKPALLYRFIKCLVWLIYPKMKVEGLENLPDGEAVIVANHAQMNGPIACELYLGENRYTWCAGEMMDRKLVPEYAFRCFWSHKKGFSRRFFAILSHIIALPAAFIFKNANTIPVYYDKRALLTFKDSVSKLKNGARIVIFPESDEKYNHIVYRFHDKFVDVAKLYNSRTGKALSFVPLYLAPELKSMHLGKPIVFDPSAPIEAERERICNYLGDEITAIAQSLPLHTVIPFENIPKELYNKNIPS